MQLKTYAWISNGYRQYENVGRNARHALLADFGGAENRESLFLFLWGQRGGARLSAPLEYGTERKRYPIRLLPLRFKNGRALIYVYRPSQLNKDFQDVGVCQLLAQQGYCTENCQQCVVRLIHKLRENAEFPHEIGLFLGYPCEDVKRFIENKAARAKCVGCWKVYGDAEKAQRQFERFKKCTKVYQKQYANGRPLTKLTVSR